MLVFFATLILLATLLYLWETRARLCKFCHPFYQSLWHFLPVTRLLGRDDPSHLAVVQHNAGASPRERVSREVITELGKQAARAIVGGLG
jgi:hypothetical protein